MDCSSWDQKCLSFAFLRCKAALCTSHKDKGERHCGHLHADSVHSHRERPYHNQHRCAKAVPYVLARACIWCCTPWTPYHRSCMGSGNPDGCHVYDWDSPSDCFPWRNSGGNSKAIVFLPFSLDYVLYHCHWIQVLLGSYQHQPHFWLVASSGVHCPTSH